MSELDAAIGAAHEMTKVKPAQTHQKGPKKFVPPGAKVPEKAGAPAVKVDKSDKRVRLRDLDHALPISISSRDGKDIKFELQPNVWTRVPDEVYEMLRSKFYKPQEYKVVDWNGDLNNPQRQPRTEAYQEYIIEFPDEAE